MNPFKKKKKENDLGVSQQDLNNLIPERILGQNTLSLEDMIAPAGVKINSQEIELGGKLVRSFFVISYPRFLSENWFAPIVNLDQVFDVSIYVHPMDTRDTLRKMQKKVAEIQSQINMNNEKGLVRNPKLDTGLADIENLRNSLQQGVEKLFNVGLYISVYADTEKDLDKAETEIRTILESKLIYIKSTLFEQEQGFQTVLPLGQDLLATHTKLNSTPLASIFPFISFDLTSDRGILYGINRHNTGLILFDRFSLENYNSVTFAKSGSGKSYATKLEILRTLMFDTDIIVIDPEKEYEQLAEAVGGRVFDISLSSDNHINPFDLPRARTDESSADILRSNINNLVGLFRILFGGITPEEDSILDQAISETYALKDITPDSDFSGVEPPLLSDFELVLSGMKGAESMSQKLVKYTQGSWANFINQPTNVDINRQFVSFSIRDMSEELKPAAMYIISHHIWNTVRQELKKRLLIIDEAWIMMKSEDTASFLYGLVKRGRKYYLGVSTITQDVEDFLGSKYGRPILTNSSIQLLLKQSPTSIDIVQKTFNLTDEEKYLLLESGVGEGIFFAGLKHAAIKIIASYTEDQIITSDPSQLLSIQAAKNAYHAENS